MNITEPNFMKIRQDICW